MCYIRVVIVTLLCDSLSFIVFHRETELVETELKTRESAFKFEEENFLFNLNRQPDIRR
jgi:hypothetical protein